MPRQTADLIALILAVVVALITVATALALLFIELTHPEQDTSVAGDFVGQVVSVLVAALVGYMAGRRINGAPH